jgi:DNA/RNA-binding domain of Phe-tRNA-synthetase-like protein
MLSISTTDDWRSAHPGAMIGLLELSGAANAQPASVLEERQREIEAQLRARYQRFTRADFLALPVLAAYERYYKRFNKTYHVQLQLESIVLKGKRLPSVSPLVDANFAAEVETLTLTAGHDVAQLKAPVTIDVSRLGDQIVQMNGVPKVMRAGDMVMRDADGVSCSIIYGQDNRSPISPATTHVLYVVYAPTGVPVEAIEAQLQKITEYVRLASPQAAVEQQRLLTA